MKPKLLDLFCGAGGAAAGYVRAGFEVYGVDLNPQPRYLDSGATAFIQADAMWYSLDGFDAIHASPPCQAYSTATRVPSSHPDLYELTRDRLQSVGVPYVIENVIGAPYQSGVVLCGSMFGLTAEGEWIQRHRNFETSWLLFPPLCSHPRDRRPVTITGQAYVSETREYSHSRQTTFDVAKRLMGIDWMNRKELAQAIPPAYTEWIGHRLREVLP